MANDSTEQRNVSGDASSRVLHKLRIALDSGNFYEAHQTYRTLYFRYMTQPRKHDELLELLYDGATKLLDLRQQTSGCDLAHLFTEFLEKTSRPIEARILDKIESIFERLIRSGVQMKNGTDDNEKNSSTMVDISSDRDLFVSNLIKWTKIVDPKRKFGHPSLHTRLANCWWRVGNYEQARYHFLLSDDAKGCSSFLIDYHLTKGYPNEVDLFITQAVLQFLCHKEREMANDVFVNYTLHHPRLTVQRNVSLDTISKHHVDCKHAGPPYELPLLNFVWLLLLCVDTGRLMDFTILVEKYQPSIKRDPTYTDYLDRIGQVYFGVPAPKKTTAGASFLRNLVSGLLGEENENNDDGPCSSAEETFESVPGTPTQSDVSPSSDRPSTKAKLTTDETLD